ncbi:hypothetical protein QLH32_02425 [Acinetobacter corruptisaponis]|uniref:Uncharacterized protein n=1 Tax=Acinetobacter corruptisaponis TaxID=3045147 RepID=A0ABY8S3P0_9GAMM|nr:hypothetical protein [Acinetobacter sp. KCTC 92772]WHP06343.1 hypothetical protein QLH32_02425 [Acinetobacter sp. KCTC 92772]
MNEHNLTKFPPRGKYLNDPQGRSQEQIDHDNYADALEHYRDTRNALEQALGVDRDFEKTSWLAAEAVEDSRRNGDKYALINRFETAVIDRLKAKEKL